MVTVRSFPILCIIVAFIFGGLANGTVNVATDSPEIRVGSELNFPPYAFIDESGQPVGFSVDLIKAIAKTMSLPIKISTGTWDNLWNALLAGQLDILPIVAKLHDRLPLVDFSLPHTETYDAFFVRHGNPPLSNIEAARGKNIVVMRSDAAHHAILEHNFQGNLVLVDTIPEGLSLISSGKYDAFLGSKLIGTILINKQGLKNLDAGPIITDYKRVFSFAVKKGNAELLEKLNQGLLIIKTNGEYDRIYEKWLTADDPWRKWKKYFWPTIVIVIAIVLIGSLWLLFLQLLVKKRTRQLSESNKMLRLAQDGLEEKVAHRTGELANANVELQSEITERKKVEEEVIRQREELRGLATRLAEVEELERQKLAEELHDYVCQNLANIGITLETLQLSAQQEPLEQLLSRLSDASDLVEKTGGITRDIMEGLRPTVLAHYGLMSGLQHLGEQFFKKTGINLEILGEEANPRLEPKMELALFRIAQEALHNVVKHARASQVMLTMEVDHDTIRLIISDNGTGFDKNLLSQAKGGRGWGLLIMTQRAMAVGGQCRIESQPGQGTRVVVEMSR